MEKQYQEPQKSNKADEEIYTDSSAKLKELYTGIAVGLIYCIVSFLLIVILSDIFNSYIVFMIWGAIILYLIAIIYFFSRRMNYFAIGLILLVTAPLAIVGGCWLLIA